MTVIFTIVFKMAKTKVIVYWRIYDGINNFSTLENIQIDSKMTQME